MAALVLSASLLSASLSSSSEKQPVLSVEGEYLEPVYKLTHRANCMGCAQ